MHVTCMLTCYNIYTRVARQDNMHVTVGAKCMLFAYQNKGSRHGTCSRNNRQMISMFHVINMTFLKHVKNVYVLSISYRYSF